MGTPSTATDSGHPTTEGPSLVRPLDELGPVDLPDVGGKAANLGVLLRAGFAVPQGFCITTTAYRQATRDVDLASVTANDAAEARRAILAAPMPDPVADAVAKAYRELGDGQPVAVRSSATAEDLPGASFAGQQDTFLNVVGVDDVLGAVHRCWASLWTDRAVAYRAAQGIDGAHVALAVVVQKMVPAATAGVLFTADPVTNRRRQAVIDAAPGLGEAVVSGSVDPDRFVVDTATGAVRQRRPGGSAAPCLTDAEVVTLSRLGDAVESAFGAPQDIEWAFDETGRAWLTQSRPITTLFPTPVRAQQLPPDDLRVYFCLTLAQGLHRPITPMGIAVFRVVGATALGLAGLHTDRVLDGPGAFAVAACRVFADATPAVRSAVGRRIVPRGLDFMEARTAVVLRGLFDDPRLSVRPGSRRTAVRTIGRLLWRTRMPVLAAQAVINPRAAHRRAARIRAELMGSPLPPASAEPRVRVDGAVGLLRSAVPRVPQMLAPAVAGFALLALAGRLLRGRAEAGDLESVLRGVPDNVTTDMDLELWALAERLRADPESVSLLAERPAGELARRFAEEMLPDATQHGLGTFLATYGHRAVAEIDLGMPRWSDDPAHLFTVLAGYLRMDGSADGSAGSPAEHFARGAAEAEAMVATLAGRARARGRIRGAVVGFCLRRARALVGLREMPKFLIISVFARARAVLAGVGDDLAAAGRLDDADDVFFLTLAEARAADGDLRALVAGRRAEYAEELRRRHIPRLLLSDGTEPEAAMGAAAGPADPGTLTGTPASAGTITAPARVVLDPADALLQPGEILVAPSTDPGWTPLFLTAGGLVMEMGGANSHGAVVAREYGIPAVVGVPGAVDRIHTGDLVEVDGAAGRVRVLDPPNPAPAGDAAGGGEGGERSTARTGS